MDIPHIGQAEIIHCDFAYECPLDWFKLSPTDDPSVRHCGTCNKPVYFCRDMGQLALLMQYMPGACAAMHARKTFTIDAGSIRMGLPRAPDDRRPSWEDLDA